MTPSAEKIIPYTDVGSVAERHRQQHRRIVFTNGCFDLLHIGHVGYLEAARDCGDLLFVGLNADDSVRRLKGPGRPVVPEAQRAMVLAALSCVDHVVIFQEDTPLNLISAVLPDVLVKGADWAADDIVGADVVQGRGGDVVRMKLEPEVSTTGLIERIRRLADDRDANG